MQTRLWGFVFDLYVAFIVGVTSVCFVLAYMQAIS